MKLININQNLNFYQNNDITIEFILLDDNSDIITELGDYTFLGEIEEQLSMDNDYFSTNEEKITLTIPNSVMNISADKYDLEIQTTISTKVHTVFRERITILDDLI